MSDRSTNIVETILQENYGTLISKIGKSGEIQIFYSLSNVPGIIEKFENNRDIARMAFAVMSLSACFPVIRTEKTDLEKIKKAFDFVLGNKTQIEDTLKRVFAELYILEAALNLYKDKNLVGRHYDSFKESFLQLKNTYSSPLLVNKIISFYEDFRYVFDLSDMEKEIGNFKSVMLYMISSDLSKRFPFFYFADMLVWSRGESFNKKVINFIEQRIKESNLHAVSSSSLAYVLECRLRSGAGLDEDLLRFIDKCKLREGESHIGMQPTTYGLYLNTRYENFACLDTNTHLLFGLINTKKT